MAVYPSSRATVQPHCRASSQMPCPGCQYASECRQAAGLVVDESDLRQLHEHGPPIADFELQLACAADLRRPARWTVHRRAGTSRARRTSIANTCQRNTARIEADPARHARLRFGAGRGWRAVHRRHGFAERISGSPAHCTGGALQADRCCAGSDQGRGYADAPAPDSSPARQRAVGP
jgi:hypothetical protein